ncbi:MULTISPECIES: hypothetical protein [Streptomycetaceae]|uniref:Uncharacterized protein n=1 Tax=Streptantibioticus cattleyicolor (strain ATCC 35852 / DSM 46488 / JCM 4925 / NBRC 14057 / NRRL 8057) TaxID=1003195 RepID=G8X005_STREN|nr:MULTISPECIES: hypothetical protein [Streptomycetaceae]AEW95606.1 hypothetical protein SCATT_32350 [Streptantibioticus cattleyicolor NRRL 8057 = DSM 46488]
MRFIREISEVFRTSVDTNCTTCGGTGWLGGLNCPACNGPSK